MRHASTGQVEVVSRRLPGRVYVFEPIGTEGELRDVISGRQVHVDQLRKLRVDRAFWYAWKRSHPATRALAR